MALLRGVPIFAHLSDEGLHTMVSNSTVRHFQKGSPIIAQGSRSSDVYVILSGKMEVTEEVPVILSAEEAAADEWSVIPANRDGRLSCGRAAREKGQKRPRERCPESTGGPQSRDALRNAAI